MGKAGYAAGGFDEGPGRGVWERCLDRGFGFVMQDMLGCEGRQC